MARASVLPFLPPVPSALAAPGANDGNSARGACDASWAAESQYTSAASPRGLASPRSTAIRSKVLLRRTDQGWCGVLPPQDLMPMGHLTAEATEASSLSSRRYRKSTHIVGDGALQVPVETVVSPRSNRYRRLAPVPLDGNVSSGVNQAKVAEIPPEPSVSSWRLTCEPPKLTPELRQDIKVRLNKIQSLCRANFSQQPRSLKSFFKELQEVATSLHIHLSERAYRRKYCVHMLHHFIQLLPSLAASAADLLPSSGSAAGSGELPGTGFLALTVLLTLVSVPWEFRYNSLTHRVCNCNSLFHGVGESCLTPAEVDRASDAKVAEATAAAVKAWKPTASLRPDSSSSSVTFEARVDELRRRERHFPRRLVELSKAVRARFQNLTAQIPTFLEELLCIPANPNVAQQAHAEQSFEHFEKTISAELIIFDNYYTQFEQLYMSLVQSLIGAALEPVRTLAVPSGALINTPEDPFREMQTASVCQHLGRLTQQVKFGGPHQIVEFDPGLLLKARRVMQMDTYGEVRSMAHMLLSRFDALCKLLVSVGSSYIQPELRENAELREGVINLQASWAECQYVLQQSTLNFISQLLSFLPRLSPKLRWELRSAMQDEDAEQASRVTLFETVPSYIYLDELWAEIRHAQPSSISCFVELFCSKDHRHHTLRSDISKWDEQRYTRCLRYLLGESENRRSDHNVGDADEYFELVLRKIKEGAAFPSTDAPLVVLCKAMSQMNELRMEHHASGGNAAGGGVGQEYYDNYAYERQRLQRLHQVLESRARWVCVQRVVQAVEPHLFPTENPRPAEVVPEGAPEGSSLRSSKVKGARGGRTRASVTLTGEELGPTGRRNITGRRTSAMAPLTSSRSMPRRQITGASEGKEGGDDGTPSAAQQSDAVVGDAVRQSTAESRQDPRNSVNSFARQLSTASKGSGRPSAVEPAMAMSAESQQAKVGALADTTAGSKE
mmetsp:Transcript_73951/g.165947  ORF Transcript_73951/g.165947 Transcript_73951/m.165947 type:complete len:956 (-) Transcript_73951:92-2959(-)